MKRKLIGGTGKFKCRSIKGRRDKEWRRRSHGVQLFGKWCSGLPSGQSSHLWLDSIIGSVRRKGERWTEKKVQKSVLNWFPKKEEIN
jgi:hypothetical protein